MAGNVQSPEKELRFTRSGQAVLFWVLCAVLVAAAVTLLATSLYRQINPSLPHPAWGCLPLAMAFAFGWLAMHLTRHAYLILTPLGIEIFPFFRPSHGMHLILWQEIDLAEVNDRRTILTLHFNPEKTSGIRLSLRPIRPELRELLSTAIAGRVGVEGAVRGESTAQ